jgi:hypothetical protein
VPVFFATGFFADAALGGRPGGRFAGGRPAAALRVVERTAIACVAGAAPLLSSLLMLLHSFTALWKTNASARTVPYPRPILPPLRARWRGSARQGLLAGHESWLSHHDPNRTAARGALQNTSQDGGTLNRPLLPTSRVPAARFRYRRESPAHARIRYPPCAEVMSIKTHDY